MLSPFDFIDVLERLFAQLSACVMYSIHRYASCSNECFILALIYIDRLIQRNNFLLSELNVHRVVITSVLLAAKFFDDAYYNNAYYAKVGGVLVHEMNGLEVDFLFRINFSLHAAPDEFSKYRNELLSHANIGVPSNDLPIMYDEHDGVEIDSTASPPPAQVSPEVHFSTAPNTMTAIYPQPSDGPYHPSVQEQPSEVHQPQNDTVMVVPPDSDYIPTQDGLRNSHEHRSDYGIPYEPTYFGFPLHPPPTVYHHCRRNSMPPAIPLDPVAHIFNTSTSSSHNHQLQQHYQPPVPVVHSGMPKSDPLRSVSSQFRSTDYVQPMQCIPKLSSYNGSMDATTSSSSTSSHLTGSATSNLSISSSSSNYYSGNLIIMDNEKYIQQPLHLWDGTPITIVQHHHHGTNPATTSRNRPKHRHDTYDATSSVAYATRMEHHHHAQQQQHQQPCQSQPVEVVAMSGVGGL